MAFKLDRNLVYFVLFVLFFLLLSQTFKKDNNDIPPPPPGNLVSKVISKYSPISLGADLSKLTDNEKSALKKLILLGKLIDRCVKFFSLVHLSLLFC